MPLSDITAARRLRKIATEHGRDKARRREYWDAVGQEFLEFRLAIERGAKVYLEDARGMHQVQEIDELFTVRCNNDYVTRIEDGPLWTDLLAQAGIARHTRLLE